MLAASPMTTAANVTPPAPFPDAKQPAHEPGGDEDNSERDVDHVCLLLAAREHGVVACAAGRRDQAADARERQSIQPPTPVASEPKTMPLIAFA